MEQPLVIARVLAADEIVSAVTIITAGPAVLKRLKKLFPQQAQELDKLASGDPSGQKYTYLEWMWKQVRNSDNPETAVDEVTGLIWRFDLLNKKKSRSPQAPSGDIKTLQMFINSHDDELQQIFEELEHEDSKEKPPKVLYEQDGFKAVELFNYEQVCEVGKGTDWCISQPGTNWYKEYDKLGVRFIMITLPDGKRRMAHIDNDHVEQLRSEDQAGDANQDVDSADLSRFVLDELDLDGGFDAVRYKTDQKILLLRDDALFAGMGWRLLAFMEMHLDEYQNYKRWGDFVASKQSMDFDHDAAWTALKPVALKVINKELVERRALFQNLFGGRQATPEEIDEKLRPVYKSLQRYIAARSIDNIVYTLSVDSRTGFELRSEFEAEMLDAILGAALKHLKHSALEAQLLDAASQRIEVLADEATKVGPPSLDPAEELTRPLRSTPRPGVQGKIKLQSPINDSISQDLNDKIIQHLVQHGVNAEGTIDKFPKAGAGQMGLALDVDGQILKITTDETEAQASLQIMRLKPPSDVFTQYQDVFAFKAYSQLLYGIVQEKLEPPEKEWKDFANQWYQFRFQDFKKLKEEGAGTEEEFKSATEKFETPITEEAVLAFTQWLRDVQKQDVQKARPKLEWLMHVAEELVRAKITYRDLKGNNLMRRGTQHVVIDLGASKAAQQSDITTISRVIAWLEEAALCIEAEEVPFEPTLTFKFSEEAMDAITSLFDEQQATNKPSSDRPSAFWQAEQAWRDRRPRRPSGGYTTVQASPAAWEIFAELFETGYKRYMFAPLKTAAKNVRDMLAGKPKPPSRAKPVLEVLEIAGLKVLIRGFSEKNESDIKDLRTAQSVIERSVGKIRSTFGVKAWPTIEIDFKARPPASGTYYPGQGKLVWWAKAHSPGKSLNESIKTFAHEFGHFVLSNYVDRKAKQAWIDLVEEDKVDVRLRDIGAAWREGESVAEFFDRLKAEDPLLAIKAEYVLLYLHRGSKIPTREELLRATKTMRLSQHPVSPYGHTDPEEAFCEAFGQLIAYGPRTVHPLMKSWMRLVLPESNVQAALLDNAAQRIEAQEPHKTKLPATLKAYHVGHSKDLSVDNIGKGEGNLILGPGVYFSTSKQFALAYQKHTTTPWLAEAIIDTTGLYDPIWGIPERLADKVIELGKGLKRNSETLRYGRGTIGDIVKHHGYKKGRELLISAGITGAYEHLPSGAIEISVFDLSILSDALHEQLSTKLPAASNP